MYEKRTDVWAMNSRTYGAKLFLSENDVIPKTSARIRKAFAVESERGQSQFILSKLPVNSFRVEFINGIFPNARFIHIIRHGIEVANSIAKRADQKRWFGGDKWKHLVDYAEEADVGNLVEHCSDNFLRGLLEWRLSVSCAIKSLEELDRNRRIEVRYEDLISESTKVLDKLTPFLGLTDSQDMKDYASENIRRRSTIADGTPFSLAGRIIAGELLDELDYSYG
jgi:hypothetical protein